MQASQFVSLCLLPFSFSLVTTACDDGPDAGPVAGAGAAEVATFDAFAQRAAAAYCDHAIVPCCAAVQPISREDCLVQTEAELRGELAKDAAGAYLPQIGAACVAALDALGCGGADDGALESCERVFERAARGGKSPTEACETSSDCAAPANGRARCGANSPVNDTPRTCQVELEIAVGEACDVQTVPDPNNPSGAEADDGIERTCARGLFCTGAPSTCRPVPKAGEPCGNGFECASGAFCKGGSCKPNGLEGAACAGPEECRSAACTDGACVTPLPICPLGGVE